MNRHVNFVAQCVLLAALCSLAGCVKLKQTLTLFPDGSGKAELRFDLSQKLIELAKQNDEDPFKEVLPKVMRDKTRGVVAFTEPVRTPGKDFSSMTYTVYFRDINKVRVRGFGEERPTVYSYKREADSAKLTVTLGPALSKLANYEPTPEEEREQVREAMQGLSFSEHYVLPGNVTAVEGFVMKDNTAKLDISLENLLQGTGPVPKLKGKKSVTLVIPKLVEDAEALEAFKKELEAAVEAYEAREKKAQLDL